MEPVNIKVISIKHAAIDSVGIRPHTDLHWGKALAKFPAHNLCRLLNKLASLRSTNHIKALTCTSRGLVLIGRHIHLEFVMVFQFLKDLNDSLSFCLFLRIAKEIDTMNECPLETSKLDSLQL